MTLRDTDPSFGHWMAGFIDGEGHFAISRNSPRAGYRYLFAMVLRHDDRPILEDMRAWCGGIGRLYEYQRRPGRLKQAGEVHWRIDRCEDCLALIRLLDVYPLRAKKARDYAIWREAVFAWSRMHRGSKVNDWSHVAALRERLMDGRRAPDDCLKVVLWEPKAQTSILPAIP